jgi:type I restriction enzyme R subunit
MDQGWREAYMKFTEAQLEAAIIELLGEEGYPHVPAYKLPSTSGGGAGGEGDNSVILKDDLRSFMLNQYAKDGITVGEIEAVINRLEAYSASDLYESNKAIMRLISEGFHLTRERRHPHPQPLSQGARGADDGSSPAGRSGDEGVESQRDLYIQLIDYSALVAFREPKAGEVPLLVAEDAGGYQAGGNIFKVVSQLEIYGYEKRTPDAILYINGLPLVVFEFKSAIREEATIHDAFVQLTVRYRRDIPELFKYNAFCMVSDGVNSKVGSLFSPYEFYYGWRSAERIPHPRPLSQRARGEDVSYRANFKFSGLVETARELRQRQTPAEDVMWALLRNRQLAGLKFRRQHQVGSYVVDFFCDELNLIVELDGSAHGIEAQQKKDKKREAYLRSLGFMVLRFENSIFTNNPESALKQIAKFKSPSTSGRGVWGEGENIVTAQGINSLYSMIQGLFVPTTLLDVIRNYIFMPDTSRSETKILCRYPQYYAATKLYTSILQHRKPEGDGKGGTYFGATGCGKSYTMLFLSRLLMRSVELSSPTIVLITDRTDLDEQLSGLFTNGKGYIGDHTVISVESRSQLRELLKGRNSGGVFLTTIHKFTEDTELLTERTNVICISDEAHRSQVNLDQTVKVTEEGVKRTFGFAKYLHDSLPNATYVGFTGTPIDATLDVFGEVVDAYTMTESVADEITVRIVYEGRAAKVLLDNSKLAEIEAYYARCAEDGASDYAIEESKRANVQMNAILGDPDRLKALAADFVHHYEARIAEGATIAGKAMFVSSSRPIAYAFYKEVVALRPEWAEVKVCADGVALTEQEKQQIMPMERIKMVMTRDQDDELALYTLLGTKEYRKELDRQFKTDKSNFKIAIVVDMWLTGFDVPFLDSMYIDKPVERHNLIQTISRVNRKYQQKEKGLIVDYIGIKKQMNLALAHYSKADTANFEEIKQSIVVVRDHLDLLRAIFHRFDTTPYFSGKPIAQLNCLNMAAEYVQLTDEFEKRFMFLAKRMKAAYDICVGCDEFTQEERDHVHFYLAVRSIVFKLTKGNAPDVVQMNAKVQQMIAEALQSDGVEEIFKMGQGDTTEVDIFGPDYLAKIEKIKLPNTRIKLLQQLLAKAIEAFRKVNRLKGIDFSKQFKALVDRYNDRSEQDVLRSEVLEEFTDEIIDLYEAIRKERESFAELGINFEEKAFYDILKALTIKYDFEYPEDKLLDLAKKVKVIVDDKARYTDWSQRNDIKAELKVDLIILLAENGYPPVDRDEVYKEIFEQAENFKKYQKS